MKIDFPIGRTSEQRKMMNFLKEIFSEIPVSITHEGKEVIAIFRSSHDPIRESHFKIPRDSRFEIHDSTLCEYWLSEEQCIGDYDATLVYARPPSRTGSTNLTYRFKVHFTD